MKNMTKQWLTAALLASAVGAYALPGVLLSNIAGDPTNVLPGGASWQAGDNDSFDRLVVSPDGNLLLVSGEQENGTADLDVIVLLSGLSTSSMSLIAREGDSVGATVDLWTSIDDFCGVNDSGQIAISGDTNAATSADEVAVLVNGSTQTVIVREGQDIPGFGPTLRFGAGINSMHILNNGKTRFMLTGIVGAATGQTQGWYEGDAIAGNFLARSGLTTPGNQIAPAQTISGSNTVNRFSSASNGDSFINVTLNGPTTSNVGFMLNGALSVQESLTVPGATSPVASLSVAGSESISPAGQIIFRGSNADTNDFVAINGQVVAITDGPVATGGSLTWNDNVSGLTATFFGSVINDFGESLYVGATSEPLPTSDVKTVYRNSAGRTQIVLSEGDRVDLNNNGQADDDAFVSIFDNETMVLLPNGKALVAVEVVDSTNAYVGDVVLLLEVPLTGDVNGDRLVDGNDVNLVLGQFGGEDPNLPEDVNGDGIVDGNDINAILANFGREG